MIDVIDRGVNYEELRLPVMESLDTKKYREAYADLMRTSKSTRESGLTYLGFLSRMKERNIQRRKLEYNMRTVYLDEKREPLASQALKDMKKGQ